MHNGFMTQIEAKENYTFIALNSPFGGWGACIKLPLWSLSRFYIGRPGGLYSSGDGTQADSVKRKLYGCIIGKMQMKPRGLEIFRTKQELRPMKT